MTSLPGPLRPADLPAFVTVSSIVLVLLTGPTIGCSTTTATPDERQQEAPIADDQGVAESESGTDEDRQLEAQNLGMTEFMAWEAWQVTRADAPDLDVYVERDDEPRPVVVLLQGSGCTPLFFTFPMGMGSSLIFLSQLRERDHPVHYVTVEKRGVESFGPRPEGDPGTAEGCSEEYLEGLAKPLRVQDVVDAIEALSDEPWAEQILVAGHSEGVAIASGVAAQLDDQLTAVGLFSSAGPSQLADFAMYSHRTGDASEVSETFDDILQLTTEPDELDSWGGHPVERWTSFAVDTTPLEDLRDTSVPVFVTHGTEDRASAIESADVFVVELLRTDSQRPLSYLRLHDVDHGLQIRDTEISRMDDVFDHFLDWALSDDPPREIIVDAFDEDDEKDAEQSDAEQSDDAP